MTTHSNSYQIGGDHYTSTSIQPWEVMQEWMTEDQFRGFLLGNVVKYVYRAGRKGDALQDLKKGMHYMQKLIEILERQ